MPLTIRSWFQAVTVLKSDTVNGIVTFKQNKIGEPVTVVGDLKGLDPNAKRGFHIQYVLVTS